jgi:hypothetical protein
MDNSKDKNIKNIMKILNINSKKDFHLVMDYLVSELRSEAIPDNKEEEIKYTDSRKPPSEREKNLYHINALALHYDFIYNVWKTQLYRSLRAIDSPIASKLYDRFTDGSVFLSLIKKAAEEQLLPGEEARIE